MSRVTVESSISLPVHRVVAERAAKGWIRFRGSWQWTRTLYSGETNKSVIGYSVEITPADGRGKLRLNFTCNGEAIEQTIRLEAMPRHYGGVQWYGRCPQTGDRASKLYLPPGGKRFLSRRAYRLAHAIQNESKAGRHCARRWAIIRKKLKSDLPDGWDKPKWMRWRTFDRITAQLEYHDEMWTGAMVRTLDRLTGGAWRR